MNDPELCFVTTNAGKLREAQDILPRPVTGVALSLEELQTTDMEVLVRHKAAHAYSQLNRPLFVEDTALIFQAWGALPGPFVKYFLEHLGLEGLVRALKPFGNMAAEAVCGVGYHDGATVHYVEGRAAGTITEPAGSGGFGFDPIFRPDGQPTGTAKTYAEMDLGEKSRCSMRGQALRRLARVLADI